MTEAKRDQILKILCAQVALALLYGRQKARTACIIGTQPVIPAVYGVKAPL